MQMVEPDLDISEPHTIGAEITATRSIRSTSPLAQKN